MNPIAQAASVLLARGPGSPELFAVRRAESLRFFGGFFAFPGGKVAPGDGQVALVPDRRGPRAAGDEATRRVTAARELFEETGVLVARQGDGSFPPSGPELQQLRREMSEGQRSFDQVLVRLGLSLHEADYTAVGTVTTPAFVPTRFETAFFVAFLPPNQEAAVWPGELDQGDWCTAAGLLDRWTRGECLVSPPTVTVLQAIRGRAVDEAPDRVGPLLESLAGGALHPIYFAPEVQLLPLRTQGLPPSTHTNAYLVGAGPAYLLDPGAVEADEQARLFEVLDSHQDRSKPLAAVVLTHHHPDHIGAAAACVDRYGVPVWAHPQTAEKLRGKIAVAHAIQDGDRLDLGTAPDGTGPWQLVALHTPGHASGHLAFYDPHYRLLFAGDMVSTLSSVVIAPPDGDLRVYLESLRRLRALDCRLLLPAHGNASARPLQVIDECLAHRARREEQLLAELEKGPRTVPELAVELYQGVPAELLRFAEWQVQAGLRKLQGEGRAEVSEGAEPRWRSCEGV